jgi:hypothetical protein
MNLTNGCILDLPGQVTTLLPGRYRITRSIMALRHGSSDHLAACSLRVGSYVDVGSEPPTGEGFISVTWENQTFTVFDEDLQIRSKRIAVDRD